MDDRPCDLCHTNGGKYVCPKCGVLYCSVSCFRCEQHIHCSEDFYKKCVEGELKLQQGISDPEELFAILKRNQFGGTDTTLDSDDDLDEDIDTDTAIKDECNEFDQDENKGKMGLEDLAKRMEDVDLDNESEIWERLSSNERKEFENMIRSGGIRSVLPDWEPWWIIVQPNPLITEINAENDDESKECCCPPLNVEFPPIAELTKKSPSANIPFMLANVLMSYTYTARWFKGKHENMPVEGTTAMFALSSVIRCNKILLSFMEAFREFELDLKNCKWTANDIAASQIKKDLAHIIKGSKDGDPHFSVKTCLCDMYNLVKMALDILKGEVVTHSVHSYRFTGSPPSLSEIKFFSKKIIYYLSWTETYGQQLTTILS